jgi:hypothetical protein
MAFSHGNNRSLAGHAGVEIFEGNPLLGKLVFMVNGMRWTLRNTGFTVNALQGVDIQHLSTLTETIRRTDDDTVTVFAAQTGLCNDMCHRVAPSI